MTGALSFAYIKGKKKREQTREKCSRLLNQIEVKKRETTRYLRGEGKKS